MNWSNELEETENMETGKISLNYDESMNFELSV